MLKSNHKLILRVDDVGWLPPHKTKDVGLRYFSEWREALGSVGVPVYYGAIPSMIAELELTWFWDNLKAPEELAVHGYSHGPGEIVTCDTMKNAASLFSQSSKCQTYIAPFNKYTDQTLKDWGEAWPGGYFLGGFHQQDHNHGIIPVAIGNTTHLSAYRYLYDHTEPLIQHLEDYLSRPCSPGSPPVVVTLHATWGYNSLGRLHKVMDLIRPCLVPISSCRDWITKAGS